LVCIAICKRELPPSEYDGGNKYNNEHMKKVFLTILVVSFLLSLTYNVYYWYVLRYAYTYTPALNCFQIHAGCINRINSETQKLPDQRRNIAREKASLVAGRIYDLCLTELER